jgi:hypothetical protein
LNVIRGAELCGKAHCQPPSRISRLDERRRQACSRSGIARRVTRPNCDTSSGALGQPHRKVAAAAQRGTDTGVGSLPTLMSFSYTFNNAIMAEYTALGDPKLASSKSDQEVLS